MYKIYLTRDILGDSEYRVYSSPITMCRTEQDCYHNITECTKMLFNKPVYYIRKTIINDCKSTVDFGSHTLFYEIIKE